MFNIATFAINYAATATVCDICYAELYFKYV